MRIIVRTVLLMLFTAFPSLAATRYVHVQATATVETSAVSRYMILTVHLRNIGGLATGCIVRSGSHRRVTGLSAGGEAEVSFNGITSYKGYTVRCAVD